MRESARRAPEEAAPHSQEQKDLFVLRSRKDALEKKLNQYAAQRAQFVEQFEIAKDYPEKAEIAEQMIKDLDAETARRRAELDEVTGKLGAMAEAEIAGLRDATEDAVPIESALESQARMTAITGDNIEDALAKAAEVHGKEELPFADPMDVEGPLETQSRLGKEFADRAAFEKEINTAIEALTKQELPPPLAEDITVAAVHREFVPKMEQAEAAAAKAQAEWDKLAGSMQELVKDNPEAKKIMNLLVASKEALRARQTRDKVVQVKKEYSIARLTALEAVQRAKKTPEGPMEVTDDMIIESLPMEVTDDMIVGIPDLPAAEKAAVKATIEKNKLSSERKDVVQKEIQKVENEIHALNEGLETKDYDGKIVYKPGIREMEAKLKKEYGIDMNAIVGAKTDAEADAAIKKSLSKMTSVKRGLLSLFSPGYRKTMREYHTRVMELADAEDRLAMSKLELKDPKKYTALADWRLTATLHRRARQARPAKKQRGFFGLSF